MELSQDGIIHWSAIKQTFRKLMCVEDQKKKNLKAEDVAQCVRQKLLCLPALVDQRVVFLFVFFKALLCCLCRFMSVW